MELHNGASSSSSDVSPSPSASPSPFSKPAEDDRKGGIFKFKKGVPLPEIIKIGCGPVELIAAVLAIGIGGEIFRRIMQRRQHRSSPDLRRNKFEELVEKSRQDLADAGDKIQLLASLVGLEKMADASQTGYLSNVDLKFDESVDRGVATDESPTSSSENKEDMFLYHGKMRTSFTSDNSTSSSEILKSLPNSPKDSKPLKNNVSSSTSPSPIFTKSDVNAKSLNKIDDEQLNRFFLDPPSLGMIDLRKAAFLEEQPSLLPNSLEGCRLAIRKRIIQENAEDALSSKTVKMSMSENTLSRDKQGQIQQELDTEPATINSEALWPQDVAHYWGEGVWHMLPCGGMEAAFVLFFLSVIVLFISHLISDSIYLKTAPT